MSPSGCSESFFDVFFTSGPPPAPETASGGPCPVGWTEVTQIARGERRALSLKWKRLTGLGGWTTHCMPQVGVSIFFAWGSADDELVTREVPFLTGQSLW